MRLFKLLTYVDINALEILQDKLKGRGGMVLKYLGI